MYQNDGECPFHSRKGQNEPPLFAYRFDGIDRLSEKGEFCHGKCPYECGHSEHDHDLIPVVPELFQIDHFRQNKEDHDRRDIAELFGHLINVFQSFVRGRADILKTQFRKETPLSLLIQAAGSSDIHIDPCLGRDDRSDKRQNAAYMHLFSQNIGGVPFNDECEQLSSLV